jgi:hypothetical protein
VQSTSTTLRKQRAHVCTAGRCTRHTFERSEAGNATPWRQGVQRGRTWYTNDVMLLVSVKLFPFGGESESPDGELLKVATGEGTMGMLFGFNYTTDTMD